MNKRVESVFLASLLFTLVDFGTGLISFTVTSVLEVSLTLGFISVFLTVALAVVFTAVVFAAVVFFAGSFSDFAALFFGAVFTSVFTSVFAALFTSVFAAFFLLLIFQFPQRLLV